MNEPEITSIGSLADEDHVICMVCGRGFDSLSIAEQHDCYVSAKDALEHIAVLATPAPLTRRYQDSERVLDAIHASAVKALGDMNTKD